MTKQPETRLQERIRRRLKATYGGWWFKVWGGPFQKAGIPDVIGCCQGLFFALEVKRGRNELEEIQKETIKDIIRDGKGIAAEVRSVEEALEIVRSGLAQAGRLPTRRSRTRSKKKNTGSSVRSGNWQDIRSGRFDGTTADFERVNELCRAADRSTIEQDDNVEEVSRRVSSTDKSVRGPRRLRKVLRAQGDLATHRSVRKGHR